MHLLLASPPRLLAVGLSLLPVLALAALQRLSLLCRQGQGRAVYEKAGSTSSATTVPIFSAAAREQQGMLSVARCSIMQYSTARAPTLD